MAQRSERGLHLVLGATATAVFKHLAAALIEPTLHARPRPTQLVGHNARHVFLQVAKHGVPARRVNICCNHPTVTPNSLGHGV